MEIAIVLDCSKIMRSYIQHFKTQIDGILNTIKQQQKGKVKVALIIYTKDTGVEKNTKIQKFDFTDNLHKIAEKIPCAATIPFVKSSIPIDIHSAMQHVEKLSWTQESSAITRILMLIGKNPPHGAKYHKLGRDFDDFPNGTSLFDDMHILSMLEDKKIHFHMMSIEKQLDQFHSVLSKTKHMESNLEYVHIVNVENEGDLIEEIKRITIKIEQNVTGKTEQNMTDTNDEKKIETEESNTDLVIYGIKWLKIDHDNEWRPILILEVNQNSVQAWDGNGEFKVAIKRLQGRNNDHDQEIMPIVCRLLKSSWKNEQKSREMQNNELEIQKNISNALRFKEYNGHGQVKWRRFNKAWHPVFIVQTTPKVVVYDCNNKLMEVGDDELKDEPLYDNAYHIAAHVKRLTEICLNYPWTSPIICGKTECCWKHGKKWVGFFRHDHYEDNIRTGVIERIINVWMSGEIINFTVRPHDDRCHPIFLSSSADKFKILDATGYKSTMENSNNRMQSMGEQIKSLKSQLEKEAKKTRQLDNEKNTLSKQIHTLENIHKQKVNSLESNIKHHISRINKNTRDKESKANEFSAMQKECHKAITMKQEAEKTLKAIHRDYQKLLLERDHLRQQKAEQQRIVNELVDKKIENSSALDLSRGFPPVQDIVRDFGLLKSQYHVEAAKLVKKIFKKKNQGYTKLRNYKKNCSILFDILMKSFEEMKRFEKEMYPKIAKGHEINDDGNQQKILEKKLKEEYVDIINKVKTQKAQKILDDNEAVQELHDNSILLKYAEECISICWVIVLVRDPNLTIEPQIFDHSNSGIEFDEKLYIEGFGSDTEQCLNFVIWPAIFREDTKYNISRITGVFIKDIPQWNKKYLKNIVSKIETPNEPIDEEKNNNAPDGCTNDTDELDKDGDNNAMKKTHHAYKFPV